MMSEKDNGGVAFPSNTEKYGPQCGMSLRDYFAGKAMQGALSAASGERFANRLRDRALSGGMSIAQVIAMDAYATADAMIAERAK